MAKKELEDIVTERNKLYGNSCPKTTALIRAAIEILGIELLTEFPYFFEWIMILNKMVRGTAPPYNYLDNWTDVQGYAELIIRDIKERNTT